MIAKWILSRTITNSKFSSELINRHAARFSYFLFTFFEKSWNETFCLAFVYERHWCVKNASKSGAISFLKKDLDFLDFFQRRLDRFYYRLKLTIIFSNCVSSHVSNESYNKYLTFLRKIVDVFSFLTNEKRAIF